MSGTRQKILQSSQSLAAEGRGEALDAEAEDAEPLMAKAAPESPSLAEQLMEEVCDRGNLERAWKRVRSNKGSPGVDGMTIDAAKDYLREHWPNIRAQLLDGVDPVWWTPLKLIFEVSDAPLPNRLSTGVPATDGRSGAIWTHTGRAGA